MSSTKNVLITKDSSDRAYSFFEELFRSDAHFHQVTEWGLFLGDAQGAQNRKKLAEHDITAIVCCHPNIPLTFEKDGISYHRCPVLDTPMFELKPHYDPAIVFIRDCYTAKRKVLVHCQKGISRSSALVIAYIMKYGWGCVNRDHDPTLHLSSGRSNNRRDHQHQRRDHNKVDLSRDKEDKKSSQQGEQSASRNTSRDPFAQPFTFEEVFQEVERKRPTAFPNIGFQEQLRLFFDYSAHRSANLSSTRQVSGQHDRNINKREDLQHQRAGGAAHIHDKMNIPKNQQSFSKKRVIDSVKTKIRLEFDNAEQRVQDTIDACGSFKSLSESAKWKRIGLFFENLHKYEFVDEFVQIEDYGLMELEPVIESRKQENKKSDSQEKKSDSSKENRSEDEENNNSKKTDSTVSKMKITSRENCINRSFDVVRRAREVINKLGTLEKIFSPTMEGVRLANALAKEIGTWLKMLEEEQDMVRKVQKKRAESLERREVRKQRKKDKKREKKEKRRAKRQEKKEKKERAVDKMNRGIEKIAEEQTSQNSQEKGQLDERLERLKRELEELKRDRSASELSSSSSSSEDSRRRVASSTIQVRATTSSSAGAASSSGKNIMQAKSSKMDQNKKEDSSRDKKRKRTTSTRDEKEDEDVSSSSEASSDDEKSLENHKRQEKSRKPAKKKADRKKDKKAEPRKKKRKRSSTSSSSEEDSSRNNYKEEDRDRLRNSRNIKDRQNTDRRRRSQSRSRDRDRNKRPCPESRDNGDAKKRDRDGGRGDNSAREKRRYKSPQSGMHYIRSGDFEATKRTPDVNYCSRSRSKLDKMK